MAGNAPNLGQKTSGRGSGPGSSGQQQQGRTSLVWNTSGVGANTAANLRALTDAKGGGGKESSIVNSQPVGGSK